MKKLLFKALFPFSFLVCLSFTAIGQTTTTSGPVSGPSQQQVQVPQTLSPAIVHRVLNEAQVPLNTPLQVLLAEYYNKNCKVTCIGIYPNGWMTFRVLYGGGSVIIYIDVNS